MDYTQSSCREFVEVLSSAQPVPGGGGAAALTGAIGVALGNMVGSLTVGKKKYAGVEEEMLALKEKCTALQNELLSQVEADAEGFEPLAKAYGIPRDDPDRGRILEEATKRACEVPLRIMELCVEGIDAAKIFAEKGSGLAVSDAGCGAAILKSALQAAALNVLINTKAMIDRAAAEQLNGRCLNLLETGSSSADAVYETIKEGFLRA